MGTTATVRSCVTRMSSLRCRLTATTSEPSTRARITGPPEGWHHAGSRTVRRTEVPDPHSRRLPARMTARLEGGHYRGSLTLVPDAAPGAKRSLEPGAWNLS